MVAAVDPLDTPTAVTAPTPLFLAHEREERHIDLVLRLVLLDRLENLTRHLIVPFDLAASTELQTARVTRDTKRRSIWRNGNARPGRHLCCVVLGKSELDAVWEDRWLHWARSQSDELLGHLHLCSAARTEPDAVWMGHGLCIEWRIVRRR